MDGGRQAAVAALIPGAAALGLLPPPAVVGVPAELLADADWTAEVLDRRARSQRTPDRRVLATVWWYSASSVLLTPVLAGVLTGVPLSARLADLSLFVRPDGLPVAAVATGAGTDPATDLRTTLTAVVAALAEAGRMRERPLWAIATDSIANRLLDLGRATGTVVAAGTVAARLAEDIGGPLPMPRFVDVGRARFVRRASCCLVYLAPHGALCTSCPHRTPAERLALLEDAARWF